MKYIKYQDKNGAIAFGVDEGAGFRRISGNFLEPYQVTGPEISLSEVRLLAPVTPSKVVAIGLNYRDHGQEMGLKLPEEPLLFLKPASSVIGPGDDIVYPAMSRQVDYEAEMGVVIGKTANNVEVTQAADYIFGYTCLNDVTARDLQAKDKQWTRAKSFDTFCPLGPWVVSGLASDSLDIQCLLNGQVKQSSNTCHLLFNVFELVSFISKVMTLQPGDVIATGTTSGIGPMTPGDEVEVRIAGIGSLVNRIVG
ncbi:MAG: fumarylacetoacetate hydrolase family protein [Deltaproteobacteria bacterium]|nr:fumarylacetoacetate hydrolase family protein [Deltaproteobacteria bacterium]